SKALAVEVKPYNATNKGVKWRSSNTNVVQVNENTGDLTARSGGVSVIRVEALDGSGKVDECEVRVVIPVTGVGVSPNTLGLQAGAIVQLRAAVEPFDASMQGVTWDSEETGIADVDTAGRVTGVSEGRTRIIVTTDDGKEMDFCDVEVTVFATGVTLNESYLQLNKGTRYTKLSASVSGNQTNKSVSWSSSDESVVSVNKRTGELKAEKIGEAVIRATVEDGSGHFDECDVKVITSVIGVSIENVEHSMKVETRKKFHARVSPSDATNKSFSWSSSDNSIVYIDRDGNAEAKSVGVARIKVTTADGAKTAEREILVFDVAVEGLGVNKNTTYMLVNGREQLVLFFDPPDATNKKVQWNSSNRSVVSVDAETGMLTAKGVGSSEVTATTEDGGFTALCVVHVESKAISVTSVKANKTQSAIVVGEKEYLRATVEPYNATNQNITWRSSNTSIASVDKDGVVIGVGVGNAVITVTTADGNHVDICSVDVVEEEVALKEIIPSTTNLVIDLYGSQTIQVTANPSNATNQIFTWSSDNQGIVDVSSAGVVTPRAVGTTFVRVKNTDNSVSTSIKVTVSYTVTTGVNLSQYKLSLVAGATTALRAEVLPNDASNKKIQWISSSPSIASVDNETGLVTAKTVGEVHIVAKTVDGVLSDVCEVSVVSQRVPIKGI
ncbi:MAG: Ig-like domain-containing protein, partial [Bacteroidales bacterium]